MESILRMLTMLMVVMATVTSVYTTTEGTCPSTQPADTAGCSDDACTTDAECETGEKCCTFDCGKMCTMPEMATTVETPTTTPYCVSDCIVDANCTTPTLNRTCMVDGCNRTCGIYSGNFTEDGTCPSLVEVSDTDVCIKGCDDNTDCKDDEFCCTVPCGTRKCLSSASELKAITLLLVASLFLQMMLR